MNIYTLGFLNDQIMDICRTLDCSHFMSAAKRDELLSDLKILVEKRELYFKISLAPKE